MTAHSVTRKQRGYGVTAHLDQALFDYIYTLSRTNKTSMAEELRQCVEFTKANRMHVPLTAPTELKHYRCANGDVITLSQEAAGYFAVECFDSGDISRWRKSFVSASEADDEYEKWRDTRA